MIGNPLLPTVLLQTGAIFLLAGCIFVLLSIMKGNTRVSKWHLLWPLIAGFFVGPAIYIRFFL